MLGVQILGLEEAYSPPVGGAHRAPPLLVWNLEGPYPNGISGEIASCRNDHGRSDRISEENSNDMAALGHGSLLGRVPRPFWNAIPADSGNAGVGFDLNSQRVRTVCQFGCLEELFYAVGRASASGQISWKGIFVHRARNTGLSSNRARSYALPYIFWR